MLLRYIGCVSHLVHISRQLIQLLWQLWATTSMMVTTDVAYSLIFRYDNDLMLLQENCVNSRISNYLLILGCLSWPCPMRSCTSGVKLPLSGLWPLQTSNIMYAQTAYKSCTSCTQFIVPGPSQFPRSFAIDTKWFSSPCIPCATMDVRSMPESWEALKPQ